MKNFVDRDRAARAIRLWLIASASAALVIGGLSWWRRWRPEWHLAEAARAVDAGDPAEAVAWLAVPESVESTRERALLVRARVALARERPSEAVGPLDRIDPDGPNAAESAYLKGRVLYASRQTLRALDWYRRALGIDPHNVEYLRWLAAAFYDLGDHRSAVLALKTVTSLAKDDARAWRTLAILYKENSEYEDALSAYEASLRIDPDQPLVRFELCESLAALGQHRRARAELEACKSHVHEGDRLSLLAQCLQQEGDTEALRKLLDEALARYPDHPGLLYHRARLDQFEGKTEEAIGRYSLILELNPYNGQAYRQRGASLRKAGRPVEAERDLARAAELSRLFQEMSSLNNEASRKPEDPEVRYRLGTICVQLGKRELAAFWYFAALACDPGHAAARTGLKELGMEGALRNPTRRGLPSPSSRG